MVDRSHPAKVGAYLVALGLGACLAAPLAAQTRISLEDVNRRQGPTYVPVYLGQKVLIEGVVNSAPLHFPEFTALAIQDDRGGAILTSPLPGGVELDRYRPGDQLRVVGVIGLRYGIQALMPETVDLIGQKAAPQPISISPGDLQSFRYLGRLVHTSARVKSTTDTMSGLSITVGGGPADLWLFLPREQNEPAGGIAELGSGDLVDATGIASQYCPRPPYNHSFEILLPNPSDVVRTQRALGMPLILIVLTLAVALGSAFILWGRERRMRAQRLRLRKTYQLGEEILGAASAEAIWMRISESLPAILGITRVHLYVYNRAAKTLDQVAERPHEAVSIPLAAPPAGTQSGAAACFHYRTLLVIPDIARSPFPIATAERNSSKSLLFVPMMAQGEVVGVLELDQDDHMRDFSADEQALAQHLANQIGAALRLLTQRSVQAQLFRTEKMAAVGRLISGVVNELQSPLQSIADLAHLAQERHSLDYADRDLKAIASEAQKASGIVARLVSYAAAEQSEAKAVSVSALLRSLIEFREGEWKASGIRLNENISDEPLNVLGSQGQLEQVFLNLLVHAEQALAEASRKSLTIRTSLLAKRLLVEISFSAPPEWSKPEEAASVLGVTRSVVAGHNGEVRLIEKQNSDPRFEVDLPLLARERPVSQPAAAGPAKPAEASSRMTALVIEPDEAAQRQLIALLAARGFRVVPLANADNGLDLSQRMRFDVAFCSVHAPGLNWVELSERMHARVGGFALLSEGYNSELAADFEGEGRFVLPKPIQESELDRVLRSVQSRTASPGKVVNIRDIVA